MNSPSESAVTVKDLYKSFRLPHEQHSGLKQFLLNFFRRPSRRVHGYETQHVLSDVSFEIKKGEFFGIVGRNGSGKSTLLKLLAGIYTPDKGVVQINGSLTPFIELGVGFNPELTGRENVYLNGALLGFSRDEMNEMYDDIVAFAELERFMDQKLKNYSSGMQVRLAFSIAVRAKSDILLIDEVLAVGDQSFQEKCFNYFSLIKDSGTTVIFVTHDMSNVERYCDRVFVIDKQKEYNGLYTISDAVKVYNRLNHLSSLQSDSAKTRDTILEKPNDLHIKSIELLDDKNHKTDSFDHGDVMKIKIKLAGEKLRSNIPVVVGIAIHDKQGNVLAGPNSIEYSLIASDAPIVFRIPRIPFNTGTYDLTVALFDGNVIKQYDIEDKKISFAVATKKVYHGKIVLEGEWEQ